MVDVVERLNVTANSIQQAYSEPHDYALLMREAVTEITDLRALSQAGAGGGVVVSKDALKAAIRRATADEVDSSPNGDIIVKGCVAADYVDPEDAAEAFVDDIADKVIAALAPSPSAGVPAKRWPFVESPGDFTIRLRRAHNETGDLLAAVRNVLIENPPTLATPPATPVQPTASVEAVREDASLIERLHLLAAHYINQLPETAKTMNAAADRLASLTPAPTQGGER